MNEKETFIRADEELNEVIQQINNDQWEMEMPVDFPTRDEKTYTLFDIITYHAYDEAWVPTMVTGKTMEEVGKDAFGGPFDNNLLGDNPRENYAELSKKAIAAVHELPDDELDTRVVHFSYGDYPAREALVHIASFRGLRMYDLAKALGQDTDIADDLVEGLWKYLSPYAEEWRAIGVFGPKVDVPDNAPLQDRLLGLTGRKPKRE